MELEINYDEALAKFIEESAPLVDVRPDGFGITAKEYGMRKGIGIDKARKLLNKLVDEGKLKKKYMRIGGSSGTVPYVYFSESDL